MTSNEMSHAQRTSAVGSVIIQEKSETLRNTFGATRVCSEKLYMQFSIHYATLYTS